MQVLVCVQVYVCKYICTCVNARGQPHVSIPQESCTLFFEAISRLYWSLPNKQDCPPPQLVHLHVSTPKQGLHALQAFKMIMCLIYLVSYDLIIWNNKTCFFFLE